MAEDKPNDDRTEIRIRGMNPKTKEELENIANNFSLTLNNFLLYRLTEIKDSYPDRMRQKDLDY